MVKGGHALSPGAAVLIVQQKLREVLKIAERVHALRNGRVWFSGPDLLSRHFSALRRGYFSGIAGNRLSCRLAGSTVMPTDSNAVTPRIGSASSGPKMTLPAVISPTNSIYTRSNSYSCTVPSTSS